MKRSKCTIDFNELIKHLKQPTETQFTKQIPNNCCYFVPEQVLMHATTETPNNAKTVNQQGFGIER